MKLNIYAIYDTAAAMYNRPFFGPADGSAIRQFSDLCVSADHELGKHPEDYSLVRLGTWDDNTAKFSLEDKETLITGNEAVAASRNVISMRKAENNA